MTVYVNDKAQESTIQDSETVEVSFDDAVFMMTDLAGHTSLTEAQRERLLLLANDIIHDHFEYLVGETCRSCGREDLMDTCHHCRVCEDYSKAMADNPARMFLDKYLT